MESQHSDSDSADVNGVRGVMMALVGILGLAAFLAGAAFYVFENVAKPVILTAAAATHSQIDQASRPRH